MEEGTPLLHFHLAAQIFLYQCISFLRQGIFVIMQPFSTGSQHGIHLLGFSSINHVLGCQLHRLNPHFILEMHMFTQQLFISLCLTSICGPHNGSFHQEPNHLPVVADGDLAESISCPVICSLLILQGKFKGSQHTHPPMSHGIKVGSCKDIHQWIVVRLHHKGCVSEVLLEMLHDAPLESEKFKLRAMIVFLDWCKEATTKSDGMVVPVILFLRQHHAQPFLGGISF